MAKRKLTAGESDDESGPVVKGAPKKMQPAPSKPATRRSSRIRTPVAVPNANKPAGISKKSTAASKKTTTAKKATSSKKGTTGNKAVPSSSSKKGGSSSNLVPVDQAYLYKAATGIFNISSDAIKAEWPDMARGLEVRFHVDEEQKKIWGSFDVGIYEGYLVFDKPPSALKPNAKLAYQWRGRESDTGSPSSGKGEVTIARLGTVKGVFRNMLGDIDFKGQRKAMPLMISGRDVGYYRNGWEEYKYGGNDGFHSRW